VQLHSTDSDLVAVITGQDARLIALKIFKLAFFKKDSYSICKVLTLDPYFRICLSSQHEMEITGFVVLY